jgi:cytochrome b pre-mRNA-processing protein 3
MILQYFKKKENEYKITADKLYLEILHKARLIIKKNYFIEINFDSSFEIITILLVFYIKNFNKDDSIKKNKVNEELIKIFISDLDKSMREIGIGDMSIGKHVKKYVKKFYYRVKILDPLINDLLSNEFIDYLNSLKLININNTQVMRQDLIVIFKELEKIK